MYCIVTPGARAYVQNIILYYYVIVVRFRQRTNAIILYYYIIIIDPTAVFITASHEKTRETAVSCCFLTSFLARRA